LSRSSVAVVNVESFPLDVAFQPGSNGLRPWHRFNSYDEYLQQQLNKTLNAKLRKVWGTSDWRRKINVFSLIFRLLLDHGLVQRGHKVMCIGARMGQEVVAFMEIGVTDAIGIDLVPAPPLVIQGDIHHHPFADSTFDFEFSNVFDHALFPQRFVSEIERTLKPSGVVVLHVALHTKSDKYSVNDLLSIDALLSLFQHSEVVHIRKVDAFGLDTEVAMRKNVNTTKTASNCATSKLKLALINLAEPLILTEPKKPWITFKRNMRSVKYLPTLTDISGHRRYVYADIGARDYGSSIGSWFQKAYPTQGHNFTVYAIEADSAFRQSYANHAEVNFLPFAAWIRNETLMFGSETSPAEGNVTGNATGNRSAGRHGGMGRIHQHLQNAESAKLEQEQLIEVQGLDIAEWIRNVAGEEDFLVVKMDVEGAEYELLSKLMETGVICLVDELFLECHYNRWQHCCPERTTKYIRTYQDCLSLFESLRNHGVLVHQWW
jgi:FkbM family methyltransferase